MGQFYTPQRYADYYTRYDRFHDRVRQVWTRLRPQQRPRKYGKYTDFARRTQDISMPFLHRRSTGRARLCVVAFHELPVYFPQASRFRTAVSQARISSSASGMRRS